MLREIPESEVPRPNRLLISLALVGALALALAGCGRKGALDPPPGGSQLEAGTVRTPVTRRGAEAAPVKPTEYDENGRPIAPVGTRKKLPADWLID